MTPSNPLAAQSCRVRRRLEEEMEAKEMVGDVAAAEEVMMEEDEEDMEGIEEVEGVEDEVMVSSRTLEKPWGAMAERTYRAYKTRVSAILSSCPMVEQLELAMCLAGSFSEPTLPSPLRPGKMAIRVSPTNLASFLRGEQGIPTMKWGRRGP